MAFTGRRAPDGYRFATATSLKDGKVVIIGGYGGSVDATAGILGVSGLTAPRCVLRPWRRTDAAELSALLADNHEYLRPRIPARIAARGTVEEIEGRIAEFARAREEHREWRYAIRMIESHELLGELSLFPRNDAERVRLEDADRVEIGYWLRKDFAGRGIVTEVVRALIDALPAASPFDVIEIRCDARNGPSIGVPQRLGFALSKVVSLEDQVVQIWSYSEQRMSEREPENH